MKKLLIFLFFCSSFFGYSQTNYQLSQLRGTFQQLQVLSPSPEMRNMIRFDNVEVSPYTGTPDVNIPLFAFECTKDLNFSMSLKYHPDAVKKEERAGSTGLGWSLFAGGSITRVVRGMPDERVNPENNVPRFGLNLRGNGQLGNDLDDFINNPSFTVGAGDNLSLHDKLFEALESGTYDTQHDLYYYNFMGYSGSFYVKMNNSGGITLVKLEDNSLKISAIRETFDASYPNDPNRYKIAGFTIFDENGNKYLFDVKETTSASKGYRQYQMFASSSVWENLNDGQGVILPQNNDEVVTAYHLTNVTPYKYSDPILTFTYNEYFESFRDISLVKSRLISPSSTLSDQSYYQHINSQLNVAAQDGWTKMRTQFGNSKVYYFNWIRVKTKKLSRINYNNKLYVNFTYESGRADSNYSNNADLVKLSNIEILSADPPISILRPALRNSKLIKQFKFNYIQASHNDKKMLLKDVIEYKNTVSDELARKYKLHYNSENSFLPDLYEDAWGYCTNVNPEINDYTTNVNYIKTFVLEKMEVPAGGAVVYNYEPHKFSYIGAQALYADNSTTSRRNETGGGLRIKNIGFFDDKNVSKDYYTQNLTSPIPAKELSYVYDLQDENLSSGSLTFPKPVFTYQRDYELFGDFARRVSPNSAVTDFLQPNHTDIFRYEISTNNNNLYALTTKGANVGYKNVTITEKNNGKKVLTFTSPLDFPEQNYTITYPFIPSRNVDYKRGLLLNEKNYNLENNIVSETINTYDYTENLVNIGVIPFYRFGHNCLKTVCQETAWIRAGLINTNQINCHNGFSMIGNQTDYFQAKPYCTSTAALMSYEIEKRVVGWAKLSKSERIDYLPSAMNNVTEYSYNPINKKPGLVKNIIGSDVYSIEYQYLNVSAPGGGLFFDNLYNRISDVKKATTKFNNEVLATENILFKDVNPANSGGGFTQIGSEMYVPEKYQYAKGSNTLEDIQTITRMDDRGNPLEVKKADGTFTTFIWGHNKTRLVAVIENCQFSEIEGLAAYTSIVSNTNNNLTATVKTNLLNHYGTLRSSLSAKSLMTALIHDIGLGVVTKIDPNGKVVNYNYSNLGNLEEVRDNGNNLLKQYFEFYKN